MSVAYGQHQDPGLTGDTARWSYKGQQGWWMRADCLLPPSPTATTCGWVNRQV